MERKLCWQREAACPACDHRDHLLHHLEWGTDDHHGDDDDDHGDGDDDDEDVTAKAILCTMMMMMMLTTKTIICFILNEELMMMRIEDRWNGSILRSQLSTLKVGINL